MATLAIRPLTGTPATREIVMSNSIGSAVVDTVIASVACPTCGGKVELIPTYLEDLDVAILAKCGDISCDRFLGFFPTVAEAEAALLADPERVNGHFDKATDHCWTCGAEMLPVGYTHIGEDMVPVFPYDCASCNAAYVAKLDAIGTESPRQLVASGRYPRPSAAWEALKAEPDQLTLDSDGTL